MRKIEVWERWIKNPLSRSISFDKGKTWEYLPTGEFYPFASIKDTAYIIEKRLEQKGGGYNVANKSTCI